MAPKAITDMIANYPTGTWVVVLMLIIGSVLLILTYTVEFSPQDKNNDSVVTIGELGIKGLRLAHVKQAWLPITSGAVLLGGALALGVVRLQTKTKNETHQTSKTAQAV